MADHAAAVGHAREHAQALAHLLAEAGDRLQHLALGQVREDRLDLLVERGGDQRERLGARLLGGEAGIARVGREQDVHRARHLAEALEPLEEARGIAGQRRQRERPAVALGRHEARDDAERRVDLAAGMLVGAEQLRAVREAVLGQEAQQLELRVVAGREPPVDLEHELLADDHRGVRMPLADRAQLGRAGRRQRRPGPATGWKSTAETSVCALAAVRTRSTSS